MAATLSSPFTMVDLLDAAKFRAPLPARSPTSLSLPQHTAGPPSNSNSPLHPVEQPAVFVAVAVPPIDVGHISRVAALCGLDATLPAVVVGVVAGVAGMVVTMATLVPGLSPQQAAIKQRHSTGIVCSCFYCTHVWMPCPTTEPEGVTVDIT